MGGEYRRRLVDKGVGKRIYIVYFEKVLNDLEDVLRSTNMKTINIVTFSCICEPNLNPELGNIAKGVKSRIRVILSAILTDSSLIYRVLHGESKKGFKRLFDRN